MLYNKLMDNYVSGSVVGPHIVPSFSQSSNNKKRRLVYIIVIIVEAVIILGLAVGLFFAVYSQSPQWLGAEDEGWLEEEDLYKPSDNEAMSLMYIYSAINDYQIKNKNMPASFCEALKTIYNSAENNGNLMEDSPCIDNKIIFLPASSIDDDLASVGEIYIGIVSNGGVYNYHISSDFSYVGRVYKTDYNSADTIIFSLDNS